MYLLLLSKAITSPNFNFILYVEVHVSGRCAHPSSKPFMYKDLNVRKVKMWLKFSKVMQKRLKSSMVNCDGVVVEIYLDHKF